MSLVTVIRKPSILVVDDEVETLKSIRRALRKMDAEVTFIEKPAKAIELLFKKTFDVILSDMKMPNINGAELLAKMAKQQPDSYRIILSGYADVESMLAAINHGKVHCYLQKPWNNTELIKALNDGIEMSTTNRAVFVESKSNSIDARSATSYLNREELDFIQNVILNK